MCIPSDAALLGKLVFFTKSAGFGYSAWSSVDPGRGLQHPWPHQLSLGKGREGKGVPWGRQRGSHHRLFALGFLKSREKLTDDPSNTAGSLCSCGIEMPSVTPSVSPIATCMIAAHFWGRELSFLICAFLPLPRLHFLLFTALVLQEFQEVNLLSVLTAVSPARPF